MEENQREEKRTEALRTEGAADETPSSSSPDLSPADRLTKSSESLFEQGLRMEEQGRLEQAVHVWTKILFVDRGNVSAKQAIQRVKRAIAERQRELDAEVSIAQAEMERGERDAALDRLRQVLRLDPRHQEARLMVEQAEARERRIPNGDSGFSSGIDGDPVSPVELDSDPKLRAPQRSRGSAAGHHRDASPVKMALFVATALMLLIAAGAYLYVNWESLFHDEGFDGPVATVEPSPLESLLPLPSRSELVYYNGVRLFRKGRYREALSELSKVEVGSPSAQSARGLILRIEGRLLRDNPAPTDPNATSGGS